MPFYCDQMDSIDWTKCTALYVGVTIQWQSLLIGRLSNKDLNKCAICICAQHFMTHFAWLWDKNIMIYFYNISHSSSSFLLLFMSNRKFVESANPPQSANVIRAFSPLLSKGDFLIICLYLVFEISITKSFHLPSSIHAGHLR